MIDGLRLLPALALPWLAASLLLLRTWPAGALGRWPGVLGAGYFLGMFGAVGILALMEAVWGGWHYGPTLMVLVVLAAAGMWLSRGALGKTGADRLDPEPGLTPWLRVALLVLIVLLAVRLGGLLLEVLLRPVYAWDAWYAWSYRARAFFEHGGSDAMISRGALLRGEDEGYHGGGMRHPPLVSMLQLWMALALGRWHESLVNLPWFFAGLALGAAVFGYLRRLGAGLLLAVLGSYLVLSVPLLNVHMALGGYADLWVTGAFGIAALALVAGLEQRRWQDAFVLLPLIVALPLLKQAGMLFAAPLVLAALVGWLRPGSGLLLVALVGATIAALVWTTGIQFDLPGLGRVIVEPGEVSLPRGGDFEWNPQWAEFAQRLWLDGSWHLLWWLLPLLLLLGIPRAWQEPGHRVLWVVTVAMVVMTLVVYGATRQADYLMDGTGFSRHILPLTPVIAAWTVLLVADWSGVRRRTDG